MAHMVRRIAFALTGAALLSGSALLLAPTRPAGLLRKDAPPSLPVSAERPAEWGNMMRREAAPVVPPASGRPKEWGSLMRREASVLPAAAGDAPAQRRSLTPAAVIALVFAVVALVGFATQAKSVVSTLLKVAGSEDYMLKGKSK